MAKSRPWTETEDKILRRLHAASISFSEIAAILHAEGYPDRTRSGVAGRLSQLRVSKAVMRNYADQGRGLRSDNSPARRCQWPLWEDKVDRRFCGKRTVAGRPYCAEHVARAYVGSKEDDRKSWEVAAG